MERSSTMPRRETAARRAEWERRLKDAFWRRRRLWVLLCVGLLVAVTVRATWSGASAATLEEALAEVAARSGVRVDPSTVTWLEEDAGPLSMRPAVFLGRRAGELNDLYYAEVRPGGEGTALDVAWLTNLSRTASADEGSLVQFGHTLAYATRVGERHDAVVVMDLRGEPASLTAGWSGLARFQSEVTNLQETGRTEGFGVRRYQLVDGPERLSLRVRDGRLIAEADGERLVLDPARATPVAGEALVELQPQTKGRPELVSWMVDTVRNVSWIGPGPIEWLENRVFRAKDAVQRGYYAVFGPPGAEQTAQEVAEDLAMPEEVTEERIAMLTVTDPELGWPPAALEPVIEQPAVEGEGRWIPVVDDPYVNAYPGAPPAFFQTFLRADPERAFTRVYVTIWDPRQVQLRIQSGVREPESATGQRGTGMIPRDPDTLRLLVGAFNGGFQALHGEFGMMASDRVYLPPKPWAATVAVFDDGRVGLGSWPAPDWRGSYYDERLANRQIPEDMVDMRQNLTSVVEDGEYNPWERWYWGAAPRNADEQTYTTRSALCLTEEGFLAYFWSQGIGPEVLGTAMLRTRCVRGLHLDMNNPHCGFEFFRPFAPGQERPSLSRRPRRESEYDGDFPRTEEDWHLRARKAVRSMGMPFPRYSDRDARDFFYLTLRPVLPGPPLAGVDEARAQLSTEGLPHAGWPHAFARTHLGAEEARTWVVRIDPNRAVPAPIRRDDHVRPLAHLVGAAPRVDAEAPHALVARRHDIGWSFAVGAPEEGDRVVLAGPPASRVPDADVAVGVDRDGFLVYAERDGDPTPLAERLAAAGVSEAVVLPTENRLAFAVDGAHPGPDGFTERPVDPDTALAFLAEERPAAEVIFEDNEPQPYHHWGYLQDQRVRYFPDRDDDEGPRFTRPGAGE
ncbi:MAG TPA: hypothetical protein RMH99_24735 [Sandaracinaceae bacterium LLY-WYZ-13_1]|nr:hypothetical protein [Sandaracinaceae bacterium LLY-WYZ-13_1]